MPLYIADYLADTQHLTANEHGAYLLLLMHHWQHGKLPKSQEMMARIARVHPPHWAKVWRVLSSFFEPQEDGSWIQKRLALELIKTAEISNKRKAAAMQKHSKSCAHAEQLHTHARASSQPQPHSSEAKASAPKPALAVPIDVDVVGEDPKAKLFRIGKTILVSFGVAERRTGALIGQWLKVRPDPVGLLAAIQFSRDQNVAEPVAYISTMLANGGARNGKSKPNISELAFELADEVRERERQASSFRENDILGGH